MLRESLFSTIKIREPLFARNCLLYPIEDGDKINFPITTFKEGIEEKTVEIKELHPPEIGRVRIENNSGKRLFALDGEEIIGAMQDRITSTSALIEANTSIDMPVACIEEKRWGGADRFSESFFSSHPRLRSLLCKGVTESLKRKEGFKSPQKLVWDEVSRKLTSFTIQSTTKSLHDAYKGLKEAVEGYIEGKESLTGTNGFIAVVGNKILGLEYFYDKELFAKFMDKLIKGYALDALEIKEPTKIEPFSKIENFLSTLGKTKMEKFPSVALGDEYRFITKHYTGRILYFEDKPIQASVFAI